MNKKWILEHGCHRGTLTSRDTAVSEYFDTREESYQAYLNHRDFYRSIGYQIWYAYIHSPDGTQELLESNSYL